MYYDTTYDAASQILKDALPIPDLPDFIQNVAIYTQYKGRLDNIDDSKAALIYPIEQFISEYPSWTLVDSYFDIKGSDAAYSRMLRECESRKIDLIITNNVSKLSCLYVTALDRINKLHRHGTGVYFLTEKLYSMEPNHAMVLMLLSTIAQEESRHRSYVASRSRQHVDRKQ